MSFFDNVADTFKLNCKKNAERKKLSTLAKNITDFCNSKFCTNLNTKDISYKEIYDNVKLYIDYSQQLYKLVEELCSTRTESSNFKNKVEEFKILDKFTLKEYTFSSYNESSNWLSFFAKNDDLSKNLKKNQEWLEKFGNIDNKFYSVWTKSIKKAVSTLSCIDMSRILADNITVLKRSNSLSTKNNKFKMDKFKTSDKLQRSTTVKQNMKILKEPNYENYNLDKLASEINRFCNENEIKNKSYLVSDKDKIAIFNDILKYHKLICALYNYLENNNDNSIRERYLKIKNETEFLPYIRLFDCENLELCLRYESIFKSKFNELCDAVSFYRTWLEHVAEIDSYNKSEWTNEIRSAVNRLSQDEFEMSTKLFAALNKRRAWVPIKDRKGYKCKMNQFIYA